jgi:hypothetical protein
MGGSGTHTGFIKGVSVEEGKGTGCARVKGCDR